MSACRCRSRTDIFGRGIRYGEDPYELTEEAETARRQVVGRREEMELCVMIDLVVKAISGLRKITVIGAITLADMIDTLEKEVDQGASEAQLRKFLMEVENSIAALRKHIEELAEQGSLLMKVVS